MFCENCGKQLPDDAAFCDSCGAKVGNASAQEVSAENTPETEVINPVPAEESVPVNETTAENDEVPFVDTASSIEANPFLSAEPESNEATPEFAEPDFSVKKPKKKLKKLIISLVSLALVATLVITCGKPVWNFVAGHAVKLFGDDKAYMGYVEKRSLDKTTNAISNTYDDMFLEILDFDNHIENELSLTVSDDALELLSTFVVLPENVELDWLKSVALKNVINMNDGKLTFDLSVLANKEELLTLATIFDLFEGEGYVGFSNLTDKYLYMDLDIPKAFESFVGNKDFTKLFPSKSKLDGLVDKYLGIAVDEIEDVEESSETLKVGDVEQKCTAIEYTITEKDAFNMLVAVLEKAADDKEIKKIIENFCDFAAEENLVDDDVVEDIYDEFVEVLEDAVDDLKDQKVSTNEPIIITDYVNNNHDVIGRRIAFLEEGMKEPREVFYYATAQKGSDIATVANIADMITISGEGKKEWGKVTAEYTVKFVGEKSEEDITLGTIELEKFDTDKLKEGYLNGTVRIKPDAALWSRFGLAKEITDIIELFDALELVFNTTKDTNEMSINVISNDDVFLGLTLKSVIKDGKKISVPDVDDTCDIKDQDEVAEFAESFDFGKLAKALKKTGMPDEWAEIFESIDPKEFAEGFMEGFEGAFSGKSQASAEVNRGDNYYTQNAVVAYR